MAQDNGMQVQDNNELQKAGLQKLNKILGNPAMREKFERVLDNNAGAFIGSILELYRSDKALQECDPNQVVVEALKAAALKLPINKSLGFAYIIPYGNKSATPPYKKVPNFQIGYKGTLQLAQRSGQYKYINCGPIYEGEYVKTDRLTGMVKIEGEAVSDNAIGYFAYFQLMNGFEKATYMSKDEVVAHAKQFSRAYDRKDGPWQTQFDAMALKTVLLKALRFGPMSVEMASSFAEDRDADVETEVNRNANGAPVILPQDPNARTVPEPAPKQSSEPQKKPKPVQDDEFDEVPF